MGLVVLKIGVGEDKDAASEGCSDQIIRCIKELPWLQCGGDDEFNREVASSGQGWRSGGDHAKSRNSAGEFTEGGGDHVATAFTLAPRGCPDASKTSGWVHDLEGMPGLVYLKEASAHHL